MQDTIAIISALIGIAMMVIALISLYTTRNRTSSEQLIQTTEVQVKLVNIEKEILEIKALMINNNNEIKTQVKDIDKRLTCVETNCKINHAKARKEK